MLTRREWLAAWAVSCAAQPEPPLETLLSRVSEEAEAFRRLAPSLFAEETLEQRTRVGPGRFRPRWGAAALRQVPVRYRVRTIVSEYAFGSLAESPGVLHEFRKVISVDRKKKAADPGRARLSLSLGMRSADDNVRKRLLLDFEKAGLAGTVTDFGPIILLFVRRRLKDYDFAEIRRETLDGVPAIVLSYRQRSGTQSLAIFEGRRAFHQPLSGELWVRAADAVPMKIGLSAPRRDGGISIREEASTGYSMSTHGVLVPAVVVHRQYSGNEVTVENVFRYSEFRRFAAESEIRFTP
jgi:hypothetical protein